MAREVHDRDISGTLEAATNWISHCLIDDRSILSAGSLWALSNVREARAAFVDHPDLGDDNFMTKLKRQMTPASPTAKQLMSEVYWALHLFQSNSHARTKRRHVQDLWALSGERLQDNHAMLSDGVLNGIGGGGQAFFIKQPAELKFLLDLIVSLKDRDMDERQIILTNYDEFIKWIEDVPREGNRQFRHMLRFLAFPDRVERISSNNDRISILKGFNIAPATEVLQWTDKQLDGELLRLRESLQLENPNEILDFYMPRLKERWASDRTITTPEGEVAVTVPSDQEEGESEAAQQEPRQSFQMQAKLAEIGATMRFRIWLPRNDRARVRELVREDLRPAFLDVLPLSYDQATLDTIEQIDVIWLRQREIVRAFEVEHTTSIFSGLLRMADLLALQQNMDIRLHIVASDERREKVFSEIRRPVFALLARGGLAARCTFLSYESVDEIHRIEHLAHTAESIVADFEESAPAR